MTQVAKLAPGGQKVLFLVEVINCNDGIASYCETLASGLNARGVEVHMVSGKVRYDDSSLGKREMLNAALKEWTVLPEMKKFPPPALIRKVRDIIMKNDISVIHAHGLGMLIFGRILSLMTGRPLVGTYHQSVLGSLQDVLRNSKKKFGPHQEFFLNIASPKALVVLSEESLKFLRSHRIYFKQRVVKVLGGTNLDHFRVPTASERQAARARFGLAPDDFVCILAGRLAWVKGQDLLVKAIRQIRSTHPELKMKCLFVGSGGGKEREEEIKAVAFEDEADKATFQFVGFMSDVREALWASDAFVLPSRFEGFALGVVEAMATGLVPIRTPAGGAHDQIEDGKSGLIVPFEDVDALAQAILKLTDPATRQRMSEICSTRAHALYGIDPMVDAMVGLYGLKAA
ncbi:glycosyltransferase family 4 protein [Xanthobacter autotrophicus]|uniref:Glycosyltransferase family 4 protein n=1 Tax=Xanthobacter autotrophicus TaxID=280 RepID=A0A6C1KGJ0_XANAU|nr:glycosyltransferase family 4 protein [Xanthobacter autotrophicus]TLX43399.1 glycosyltransferase family 4 protein [Xanthobacter autotrophicus]